MTTDRVLLEAIKERLKPPLSRHHADQIDVPWLVERLEEALEALGAN